MQPVYDTRPWKRAFTAEDAEDAEEDNPKT
jgi:hypothetical protein